MHLVAWLPPGEDDELASARALEAGIEASPLSRYAETPLERGGLVLGWAAYSPDRIRRAVEKLAAALR
jgi:GntR family transcriptional regulator/MocR family aminotransferase